LVNKQNIFDSPKNATGESKNGYAQIYDRLDFSWATDPIDYWDKKSIFHNAGVTCACGYFYKGNYINELPYHKDLRIKKEFCSYNYYEEIKQIEKKSCLINK
jgi:hypothetical protein